MIYVLDPSWLVELLEKHRDTKDAERRWEKYNRRHPNDTSEDDCDRLYLPVDEDDAEDPLLAIPEVPILWDSPHVSRRVAAQRSRFMVFGTDPYWLSDLVDKKGTRLFSIGIPASSIADIKQDLRDAGITESVVFPDFDGLGRELRQVWETRR